jgi:hypothetical protein
VSVFVFDGNIQATRPSSRAAASGVAIHKKNGLPRSGCAFARNDVEHEGISTEYEIL